MWINNLLDKSTNMSYNVCMKSQTFNISLPHELVSRADDVANKESRSRSELMREALRAYLDKRSRWDYIYVLGEQPAKANNLKSEDDVVKLIREYRSQKSK